jgi:hypothetical protein
MEDSIGYLWAPQRRVQAIHGACASSPSYISSYRSWQGYSEDVNGFFPTASPRGRQARSGGAAQKSDEVYDGVVGAVGGKRRGWRLRRAGMKGISAESLIKAGRGEAA